MEQTQSPDSPGVTVLASASVLFGIGLLMFGNGLQGSLIGVRATVEQFNSTVIGIIMASYFVGFLVGSTWTPSILRKVGHIRVFAGLTAIASVTILAQDLFVQSVVWGVMRFLAGVCFAGIYVVAESWLNSFAGNRTRAQLLAIYMVIMYTGLSGGQFLLNLAEPASADLFMIASGLISLAVVPMLLSGVQAPERQVPLDLLLTGKPVHRDQVLLKMIAHLRQIRFKRRSRLNAQLLCCRLIHRCRRGTAGGHEQEQGDQR
ncbi:hypothetical protein CF392_02870 [Tamilnaduibacter salinus]|uniref:MFS transporter n=1 Tax=Tamilnaduibacter salinus TaxID=1484056 RepID=A0A2A2I7J0_9GAMM|nr:MFS transporter [Tamilnaduibacter salinus]PAV27090.1 hypothetical protein CF392_02870 [Tamilnaduibacter salinus]